MTIIEAFRSVVEIIDRQLEIGGHDRSDLPPSSQQKLRDAEEVLRRCLDLCRREANPIDGPISAEQLRLLNRDFVRPRSSTTTDATP